MNLADITTKSYILTMLIRDDGERFLLGDGAFEFKDNQQHFQPNTYANDVVELQGTDGQMLAGQVRRTATQTWNGYIGDATTSKQQVEQYRRSFFLFFRPRHYYTAVYIFCDGSAIQRKRGYIVNAPSVPELWQKFPEWSVGLNFEDPNYYEYAEDDEGNEIYAHAIAIALASSISGGLIWDGDGAVSDDLSYVGTEIEGEGKNFQLANTGTATLKSAELLGDAEQTTYSGQQLYNYTDLRTTGTYLAVGDDGWYTFTADRTNQSSGNYYNFTTYNLALNYSTSYAIVTEIASSSVTGTANVTPVDRWGQFDTALTNSSAVGTYVGTRTTKSAWGSTEGLSSNVFVGAGSKATIKFRISVIADTSVTPTTFAYEPYVGGTASPNPDYPQAVNTVTGEQTVKIEGKNLFDNSASATWNHGSTSVSSLSNGVRVTQTDSGSYRASGWVICRAEDFIGKTISLSAKMTPSSSNKGAMYIAFSDATGSSRTVLKTGTSSGSISATISSIDQAKPYIAVALYSNYDGTGSNGCYVDYSELQLELAHDSFEPSYLPTSWTNTTAVYETLNLQPNTTYTLSSTIPRASGNALLFFLESGQSIATNTNGVWDGQTRTLTTDATGSNLQLAYRSFSGETRTRDDYEYALLSATAYEPYQRQTKTVNLGKNLIYTGDRTNQGITFAYNATTGETSVSGTASTTYANALQISEYLPAGTYTLSIQDTLPFTVGIGTRNSANTRTPHGITAGNKTLTFTLTEPAFSYDVYLTALTSGSQINSTFKLQCEKGSSASSFAPYFTPYELAKIGTYQGRIYKSAGKWYIEKNTQKLKLTSSLSMSGGAPFDNYPSLTYFYSTAFDSTLPAISAVNENTSMSSFAKPSASFYAGSSASQFDGSSLFAWDVNTSNTNRLRLAIPTDFLGGSSLTNAQRLANWKTALDANDFYIVAPLQTPTTTEITNTELIRQLERLRHSHTYADTTNFSITATSPNLPAFLKVVAFGDDAIPQGGYVWEDGGSPRNIITIDGVDSALPIWKVNGPATNPTLTNITTGQTITWTGFVPSGQTLTIDMGEMTASLAGANVFEYVSGEWIELQSGNNLISYTAQGGATDPSTLEWNGVTG